MLYREYTYGGKIIKRCGRERTWNPKETRSGAIPIRKAASHQGRLFRPNKTPPHSPCARKSMADYSDSISINAILRRLWV
jgi:hypothetical protein